MHSSQPTTRQPRHSHGPEEEDLPAALQKSPHHPAVIPGAQSRCYAGNVFSAPVTKLADFTSKPAVRPCTILRRQRAPSSSRSSCR